jgi:hypothetical protein
MLSHRLNTHTEKRNTIPAAGPSHCGLRAPVLLPPAATTPRPRPALPAPSTAPLPTHTPGRRRRIMIRTIIIIIIIIIISMI